MVLRITVHSEAATTHSTGVETPSVTSTAEAGTPHPRNTAQSAGLLTIAAKKPREMLKTIFPRSRDGEAVGGLEEHSRYAVSAVDEGRRVGELTAS